MNITAKLRHLWLTTTSADLSTEEEGRLMKIVDRHGFDFLGLITERDKQFIDKLYNQRVGA